MSKTARIIVNSAEPDQFVCFIRILHHFHKSFSHIVPRARAASITFKIFGIARPGIKFRINTLRPLYNMVHYNMVLDITRFKDGSQNVQIILKNIIYTFLFG